MKKKSQSVIRSAGAMSLGTLLSRVLGLVRDQVLASLFPKMVTDAFVVAFRLPNMFRRLMGEGALAVSFIPIYLEKKDQGRKQGQEVASVIMSFVFLVSLIVSLLGVLFLPELLTVLVSGESFSSVPGKVERAIFLGRIMFSYLFLVSVYSFFMSLLQANTEFLLPALAPAFFNLCVILVSYFFVGEVGVLGSSLAIGVLIGGVVQALIVFFRVYRLKLLPHISFRFAVPGVKKVFTNMLPGLLGMGVLQIMGLANLYFASLLPEGTHSFIYLADRVLEFPQSLIAISMGAALLPTLSALHNNKKTGEFVDVIEKNTSVFLFLALPSAIGLFFLARPIVQVLFMRGAFNFSDVVKTAEIIHVYSFILIVSGWNRIVTPAFFAIQNTWLPALTSFISLCVHLSLALLLTHKFGLQGLMGSVLVSSCVNAVLLHSSFSYFIKKQNYFWYLRQTLHFLPSLLVMGSFLKWGHWRIEAYFVQLLGQGWGALIALCLVIAISIMIYFSINTVLKVPQASQVLSLLAKRRRAK